MVTFVPTGPDLGLNARIDTAALPRAIDKMLPAASYVYVAVLPAASAIPMSRPASSYAKTSGSGEGESEVVAAEPVVFARAPRAGEAGGALGAAYGCAPSTLAEPSKKNAITTR
jgi:hypothetical protein